MLKKGTFSDPYLRAELIFRLFTKKGPAQGTNQNSYHPPHHQHMDIR